MPIKELIFEIQQQKGDFWCWAATAASVSFFYDHHTVWTQCKIACSCLNRNDCCPNRPHNPCDQSYYLDRALGVTQNFVNPLIERAISFLEIQQQIDNEKIIGARVEWKNGDGHFVVIHGYQNQQGEDYVYIADPIYRKSILKLSTFKDNYKLVGGSWTHSYLTKSTLIPTMISLTDIHQDIIQKALAIKPALEKNKQKKRNLLEITSSSFSTPHAIYHIEYITLNQILIRQIGFRIVGVNEDNTIYLYDFDNDGPEAQVLQIIYDDSYTENYQATLQNLTSEQVNDTELYTLNIVQQPELKLEVFWLHQEEDSTKDKYIPIISSSLFERGRVYSASLFLDILKQVTREKEINYDRLRGG